MGFSRQEYWSGLPFPSSGGLPGSGIEPMSPALAGGFFTTKPPGKSIQTHRECLLHVCCDAIRNYYSIDYIKNHEISKETQTQVHTSSKAYICALAEIGGEVKEATFHYFLLQKLFHCVRKQKIPFKC